MAVRTQAQKSERAVARILDAGLGLFSTQGFRATSMRQIAGKAKLSLGNVYHHFPNKEAIFERLLATYWGRLRDPDLRLNRLFREARFPDDLEDLAAAIEQIVRDNRPYILLIYIDVIEFRGEHLREFYGGMPERFQEAYGERFEALRREGSIGDVDPMVAVMVATRWFFYFHTIEQCFGVPMHFGMTPDRAIHEFIRILRRGIEPRTGADGESSRNEGRGRKTGRSET
jgi:AcrR family transcriptional regulator